MLFGKLAGMKRKWRGERADKESDDRFYIAHIEASEIMDHITLLPNRNRRDVPKVMALLFIIMLMFY